MHRVLLTAATLAISSLTLAQNGLPIGPRDARTTLEDRFPGVRFYDVEGRVRCVYGKPMTGAAMPAAAAQAWWQENAAIFGVAELDLAALAPIDVSFGRFTAFPYTQRLAGLPVDESMATVLVLNADVNRVVYAAARVMSAPPGGFAAMRIDAAQAVATAEELPIADRLVQWTEPLLVVYTGGVDNLDIGLDGRPVGSIEPARAWAFTGRAASLIEPKQLMFFVDAATGEVLGIRNRILHTDVVGTVRGMATPGNLPDRADNLPVSTFIDGVKASISGGNSDFTDVNGTFLIPHGGQQQVTVSAGVVGGEWVTVNDLAGAEIVLSQSVLPPGPADFLLNASPTEQTTAQVNAFHHTMRTYRFVKDRAPSFMGLDNFGPIPANVNLTQTCNAYYDYASINFFLVGGGCVNTAYSTVVSHEYGHHCVTRHEPELAQGAFGEGFSDCIAMLLQDTPVIGEDFYQNGGDIRRPDERNRQYPCNGGSHDCGEVLGGVWWEIVKAMRAYHGDSLGMELSRQLFVDWYIITQGGQGSDSAHPQTAIEVLTVNDDDGDIDNGTPDAYRICRAFGAHNIDCQFSGSVAFAYPDGVPSIIGPGVEAQIRVNVTPTNLVLIPGTGTIHYSIDDGAFTSAAMVEGPTNEYTGTIPAQDCGHVVRFYVSVEAIDAGLYFDPEGGQGAPYRAPVGTEIATLLVDEVEAPGSWTLGMPDDTATDGLWTWGDPIGTYSLGYIQPEDDHTADPGVNCFFTGQGVPGGSISADDVDGGKTTLVTPAFDLADKTEARIGYWRWYNNLGAGEDSFLIEITNDGANWARVELVGPAGEETDGEWFYHEFLVDDILPRTATMQIRFIARDLIVSSTVEAAIDDLSITYLACTPPCAADMNGDGLLNVFDFLGFQALFGNDDPKADLAPPFGTLNLFDFLAFQTAFGNGC